MPQDGDLREGTRVDVLPVDGMQEVRGSNPLSSTEIKFEKVDIEYSRKYSSGDPDEMPCRCSDKVPSAAGCCWQGLRLAVSGQRRFC